jgi:hypothetical protein
VSAQSAHEWLVVRVTERLQLAQAATPGPWHIGNAVDPTRPCNVHAFPSARGVADEVGWLDAEHIAANDPATVIAMCEATLRRLERHKPVTEGTPDSFGEFCEGCGFDAGFWRQAWPCPEFLDDAAPYAGRDDYPEELRRAQ